MTPLQKIDAIIRRTRLLLRRHPELNQDLRGLHLIRRLEHARRLISVITTLTETRSALDETADLLTRGARRPGHR